MKGTIFLLIAFVALVILGLKIWDGIENAQLDNERKARQPKTVTETVEQMVKDFEEPNMFEKVDNQLIACNKLIDEGKIICGSYSCDTSGLDEEIELLKTRIETIIDDELLRDKKLSDCYVGSDGWMIKAQKYGKLLRDLGFNLNEL